MFVSLIVELRRNMRAVARTPGTAATAIVALGLGIAAPVIMFAIIDAISLRHLPYPAAGRLVVLSEARPAKSGPAETQPQRWPTSRATLKDWREGVHSYSAMSAYSEQRFVLWRAGEAEDFPAVAIDPGYFDLLGVAPLLGRRITSADTLTSAQPTAVLSYQAWRTRFGSDKHVIGRVLNLSGNASPTGQHELRTIVGVMPKAVLLPPGTAAWIPARQSSAVASRTDRRLWAVARMRQGVSVEAANRELSNVTHRLANRYPQDFQGFGSARVVSLTAALRASGTRGIQLDGGIPGRHLEFELAGILLLIAIIDVGTLILARSVSRNHEVAVQAALGASRSRIAWQLVGESAVIAIPGAILGALVAFWSVGAVARAGNIERFGVVPVLDWRVLLFAAGLTTLVIVATSLAPIVVATRSRRQEGMRLGSIGITASRRSSRIHAVLLVVQVAAAFVTLAGAALLGRELMRLETNGFAFDTKRLVWFPAVRPSKPLATPEAAWRFTEKTIADLRTVPGVQSVTAVAMDFANPGHLHPVGRPEDNGGSGGGGHLILGVSPGFQRELHLPLLKGRDFSQEDFVAGAHVGLITAFTAHQFWPNGGALGQEITVAPQSTSSDQTRRLPAALRPSIRVVGIVANARFGSPIAPQVPTVFIPVSAVGTPVRLVAFFLVRTAGDPAPIVPELSRHIGAIQGAVPLRSMYGTTQQVLDLQLREQRLMTYALVGLALAVVLLTGLGVHGLVAYAAAQRSHEIAIRMALGADARRVRGLLVVRPLLLAAIGIAIGGLGVFVFGRVLRTLLHRTSAADPIAMATAVAFIFGVVLVASWFPSRNATRTDPMLALRAE